MAGQRIHLQVLAPQGFTLRSQTWSFSRPGGGDAVSDITGGFVGTSATYPSSTTGGQEASNPDLTQQSVLFYFVNIGATETVNVTTTYTLADGSASQPATASLQFAVGGPTNVSVSIGPNGNGQLGAVAVIPGLNSTSPQISLGNFAAQELGINITVDGSFPSQQGWIIWMQTLKKDHIQTLLPLVNGTTVRASCYPKQYIAGGSAPQLDALYPAVSYNANQRSSMSFNDTPSSPLVGDLSQSFSARTYLMWDPAKGVSGCTPATSVFSTRTETASTCTSTPVVLGYIDWGWDGEGVDLLKVGDNGSTGHLQPGSGKVLAPFNKDSTYPEWTTRVITGATFTALMQCNTIP